MGSPLSPLLAEIFLNNLETNFISTHPLFKKYIFFWRRYVDDVFVIFKGNKSDVPIFLSFLNSLHTNIEFTSELPVNNCIPFLDLFIKLSSNKINFSIYRKPTTTDHVIPFHSNHPIKYRLAAFHSFFHRLLTVPLSAIDFQIEYNTIIKIAKNNNFPLSIINNIFNKKLLSKNLKQITSLCPIIQKPSNYFSIPYLKNISPKIQKFFKKYDISISFKQVFSLKSAFCHSKDPIDPFKRSGVYKLTCSCNKFYIGRSFRSLETRLSDHIKEYKKLYDINHPPKSTFSKHVLFNKHTYPDSADIIFTTDNNFICDIFEQLCIIEHKHLSPNLLLNDQTEFSNIHIFYNLLDKFTEPL